MNIKSSWFGVLLLSIISSLLAIMSTMFCMFELYTVSVEGKVSVIPVVLVVCTCIMLRMKNVSALLIRVSYAITLIPSVYILLGVVNYYNLGYVFILYDEIALNQLYRVFIVSIHFITPIMNTAIVIRSEIVKRRRLNT